MYESYRRTHDPVISCGLKVTVHLALCADNSVLMKYFTGFVATGAREPRVIYLGGQTWFLAPRFFGKKKIFSGTQVS